jgi:hypothetical protein
VVQPGAGFTLKERRGCEGNADGCSLVACLYEQDCHVGACRPFKNNNDNSTAMYNLLKTLHPGGIRTRDLLFCRRTR